MKDKNTQEVKDYSNDPFMQKVMEANRKAAEIARKNLESSPYRH
jgi:hypothetical protein